MSTPEEVAGNGAPEIGANIGALLETRLTEAHVAPAPAPAQAAPEASTVTLTMPPEPAKPKADAPRAPARAPAPRPQRRVTVNPHLVLVGIEMKADPGKVSFNACAPRTGWIITGPELGYVGLLSRDQFMHQLRVTQLRLNPFHLNHDGSLGEPGSLVPDRPGNYVCPNCKAPFPIGPRQYERLKASQQREFPCCERCKVEDPGSGRRPANRLVWQTQPPPRLGVDEPRVQRLFDTFEGAFGRPVAPAVRFVPRIWAVYHENQAPDEVWVPPADDARALTIAERQTAHRMVIRPWSVAKKAGMPVKYLLMEGTTCGGGQPGMIVGWMSHSDLGGCLSGDPEYGFTVRLAGRRHDRRDWDRSRPEYTV